MRVVQWLPYHMKEGGTMAAISHEGGWYNGCHITRRRVVQWLPYHMKEGGTMAAISHEGGWYNGCHIP